MLNIEKYKDDILNTGLTHINCCVNHLNNKGICFKNCKECKEQAMKWLLEEYSEPILDDVERKYLSAIIKPFKNKVTGITKIKDDYKYKEGKRYIRIIVRQHEAEYINLPWFEENTMYKGMKDNREYTLKELGL